MPLVVRGRQSNLLNVPAVAELAGTQQQGWRHPAGELSVVTQKRSQKEKGLFYGTQLFVVQVVGFFLTVPSTT